MRLPRFKRTTTVVPIQLTARDHAIIRLVHRHRFLRSDQIIALLEGSPQNVSRRLQLLYHHGYLERPRAQLEYYQYDRSGSRHIAYGLGNKGGAWLRREHGIAVSPESWGEKNHVVGRVFLDHTLLVSDVMVSLELACRRRGVRLIYEDGLDLLVNKSPFRWWAKMQGGTRLGIVPDCVFALEWRNRNGQIERSYFFLEADRGTMPVMRQGLKQTSIYRKLLAYEATWANKVHQRYLGIHRFRVLTVTTSAKRLQSMLEACCRLKRGHGLFLFADVSAIENDLLSSVWLSGKTGEASGLINETAQSHNRTALPISVTE